MTTSAPSGVLRRLLRSRLASITVGLAVMAAPLKAQTVWQLLNETGTSSFKNAVNTGKTVTVSVPSGAAVTIYTTDFSAINLASGEKYSVNFSLSSTAGITGAVTSSRILGIGLFDSNSTSIFADDMGMMTWIRSDSTFELRQKNGTESVESLLKFGAYTFTNLGTGTGGTAGALADNTTFLVNSFQVDYTGSGYRFGTNTTTNPGLSFTSGAVSRLGYTNPGTITSGLSFDLFGVYFMNTSGSAAEFTLADVSFATAASAIPEPSTYAAMFGAAAFGLAVWHRRRTRRADAAR